MVQENGYKSDNKYNYEHYEYNDDRVDQKNYPHHTSETSTSHYDNGPENDSFKRRHTFSSADYTYENDEKPYQWNESDYNNEQEEKEDTKLNVRNTYSPYNYLTYDGRHTPYPAEEEQDSVPKHLPLVSTHKDIYNPPPVMKLMPQGNIKRSPCLIYYDIIPLSLSYLFHPVYYT